MIFSVRQENNEIIVSAVSAETEVRWFCSVDGNFVLSSYGGVAPSVLEIYANDEDHIAKGVILFNYYDGDCIRQETFQPYLYEKGWGVVYPERETFEMGPNNQYKPFTVRTNNSDWTVNVNDDYRYIKVSDTKFYLIKNECNSNVTVSATINVNETNAVVYINEVVDPRAVVNPAPKMVTGLVYNGRAQALVTGGRAENGTMLYKIDNGDWSTEIPRVVNASPDTGYTVCYMAKGNPGYLDSDVVCIPGCMIAKANPVIDILPERVVTTYNGNPQALIVSGSVTGGQFIYKLGTSGTPSQEIPTEVNAGEYIVSFYVKGDENHKDSEDWSSIASEIKKATPVINPEPVGGSLTYAGTPQYLASVGVTDLGRLEYSLDNATWQTSMVTGTNVGSYTVYYRVSGDTNLYEVTGQTNANIAKVTPTVIPPKGLTLGYTGEKQELIIAGSTDFGILKYSLDDSSYSTAIPSGETPQDYVVYYKVEGDDNINEVTGSVLSKISDAIPSYTPPIGKTGLVFNDEFQELFTSGSVVSGQGVMYYSFIDDTTQVDKWEADVLTASGASAYTVYWYVSGITPYESTEVSTLDVVIDKAHTEPKPTPTGLTLVYNEGSQALLESGETSGGTMVYCIMSADTEEGVTIEWSEEIPSGITAGTYEIAYMLSGDSNHYDSESATTSSTIDKLTLTFDPSPKANAPLIYNGELQDLVITGKVGNWNDGVIEYSEDYATWSSGTPQASEIGTYTIYWRALGDENHYDFTGGNISAEIKRGVAKIIVVPEAIVGIEYDGNMHELVTPGTAENGTMVYRIGNGEWSTSIPKAKDTGVYVVYFMASGDTGFDNSEMMSLNCSIGVAVPDYDPPTGLVIEYDGQEHELVAAGTVRSGGTMKYSLDGATWSTNIPTASDKGTYLVYWKVDGDEGYASVGPYQVATTIAKSVPSFSEPTAKTGLVYNGSEQDLINPGTIYDGEGTFYYNVNDGEYSTSIPKGTNPGSYTVGWKIDDGTYGSGTLSVSIVKITPTVTPPTPQEGLVYDGTPKQLLASKASIVEDSSLNFDYSLSESEGWTTDWTSIQGIDNGTYTIYYKFDGNEYYDAVATNHVSAVIGGSGEFTPPRAIDGLVWNGSEQTLVVAGSMQGAAGTFYYRLGSEGEFSTELTKAIEPNEGYVTEWKLDDGSAHSGTCTTPIAKKTPTVTAPEGGTMSYTGEEISLLKSCGSISDNLSLEYQLDGDSTWTTDCSSIKATDIGTYTIWYRYEGDEHYNPIDKSSVTTEIKEGCTGICPPVSKDLTYNGQPQELAEYGSYYGEDLIYWIDDRRTSSTTVPSRTDAGDYDLRYYYKPTVSDSAYTGVELCRIKKANNAITIVSGDGSDIESISITDQETASVKAASYSGDGTVSITSSDSSIITITEGFDRYAITPVGVGNCTIVATITEGSNFFSASSEPIQVSVTQSCNCSYVDLGLPSGTLWYTCNAGSSCENQYGDYYMYGKGNTTYDMTDEIYEGIDNLLPSSADTATQVIGGSSYTPTKAQFEELIANTTYEWTTLNGTNGAKFTAQNGNFVFFPANGFYQDGTSHDIGSACYYWAATSYDTQYKAYALTIGGGNKVVLDYNRNNGYSVRSVMGGTPICACEEFRLTGNISMTHHSQSLVRVASCTLPLCGGSIISYSTNANWVSGLTTNNNIIYGDIAENSGLTSRSGEVTVTWENGNMTCSKTCYFMQNGTPEEPCQEIFRPESGQYSSVIILHYGDYAQSINSLPYTLHARTGNCPNIRDEYGSVRADGYLSITLNPNNYTSPHYSYNVIDSNGYLDEVSNFISGNYQNPETLIIVYCSNMTYDNALGEYAIDVSRYFEYTPTHEYCQETHQVNRLMLTPYFNMYDSGHNLIRISNEPYLIDEADGSFNYTVYANKAEVGEDGVDFTLSCPSDIEGRVYLDFGPYPYVVNKSGEQINGNLCDEDGNVYGTENDSWMYLEDHVLCPSDTIASSDWEDIEKGITYVCGEENIYIHIPGNFHYQDAINFRLIFTITTHSCGDYVDETPQHYNPTPRYNGGAIRANINVIVF